MTYVLIKWRSLDTHTSKGRTPHTKMKAEMEEKPRTKSRNTRKAPEARRRGMEMILP